MTPTRKSPVEPAIVFDGEPLQELKRRLNAVDRPLLKISGHGAKTQLDVIDLNRSPEAATLAALTGAKACPPGL